MFVGADSTARHAQGVSRLCGRLEERLGARSDEAAGATKWIKRICGMKVSGFEESRLTRMAGEFS
jgi:hypothetical protein